MVLEDDAVTSAPDASSTTLGDVIFSKSSASPPSETVWVALVRSIAAGDKRALHALYSRTHKIVFTLVMRIARDPQTAEELTLDVFHDVWRRAHAYDAVNGSVIGWVLNQARSRAIDRLRFDQRKKRVDPGSSDPDAGGDAQNPLQALEGEQRARRVRDAVDALSKDEREAIETAFFGGLTHAETAVRLDAPLGTVKTRIRSALEKLRGALTEDSKR